MCIQNNFFQIKLEEKFEICKDLFKGILPADPRRLFDRNPQFEFTEDNVRKLVAEGNKMKDVLNSPQSLLQTLSAEKGEQQEHSNVDFMEKLTRPNKAAKNLVQEVGSGMFY